MSTITDDLVIYDRMEQRERWRPIPGFIGSYEVSDLGRVRSYCLKTGGRKATPHLKSTWINAAGYLSVTLQREASTCQAYAVHVLVAAAFLGPRPDGMQVAHSDGDGANARLDNLRYASAAENAHDKIGHGTDPRGEQNPKHKLTEAQVREIRKLYSAGLRQKDLAAAFNVRQQTISNVVRGRFWSHVSDLEVAS